MANILPFCDTVTHDLSQLIRLRSSCFRKSCQWVFACALVWVVCISLEPAFGGETDAYSKRFIDLDDSLVALDAKVNEALDHINSNWSRGCNEDAFITAIYRELGGFHLVDEVERWAMFAPEIHRLPLERAESVYADIPFVLALGARLGNFTQTMNVGGSYISTDKLGHFFSQGRKFLQRYQRLGSVEKAAERTAIWEGFVWGEFLSGIYSNADLIANYEGFLFYRSLFNSGVVDGREAIFRCEGGNFEKQRDFTWEDHVNALWDEMINPSYYRKSLVPAIEQRMLQLCSDYEKRPRRYQVENQEDLQLKYQAITLRESSVPPISEFLEENCV